MDGREPAFQGGKPVAPEYIRSLSDKYDLTKHPDYKYTADVDKKYLFDMERYMKRRPAIVKPDEPFEMYELTAADLQ